MSFREEGECIGGGGFPMRKTEELGPDHKLTGQCSVCTERMTLDSDGLIPKHQRPQRDPQPAA